MMLILQLHLNFSLKGSVVQMKQQRKNGTVLYCGEYGVIDLAEHEDALKWFKAINTAFDRLGISRAAWSYKKMDFGISDSRMDNIRSEIIKYL